MSTKGTLIDGKYIYAYHETTDDTVHICFTLLKKETRFFKLPSFISMKLFGMGDGYKTWRKKQCQ